MFTANFLHDTVHFECIFVGILRVPYLSFILSLFLHGCKLIWILIPCRCFLNIYNIFETSQFFILIRLNYVFVNLVLPSCSVLRILDTSNCVSVFNFVEWIGSWVDVHCSQCVLFSRDEKCRIGRFNLILKSDFLVVNNKPTP